MVTGKAVPLLNMPWRHLGEQRNSSVHQLTCGDTHNSLPT